MPVSSVYKHYSLENSNLPTSLIYKIYPDDNGYLWLTTDKGVIRYDYKKFEPIYTGKDNDFPLAIKTNDNQLLLFSFRRRVQGIDFRTQHVFNADSLYGLDRLPHKGAPYLLAQEYNGRIELSTSDTISPVTVISKNRKSSLEKSSVFIKHLLSRYGIAEGQFDLSATYLGYLKMIKPYAIQPKGDYLIIMNRIFLKEKGKPVRLFFNGNAYGSTSEILGFARSEDDLWIGYLDSKGLVKYTNHYKSGKYPKAETVMLRGRVTDVVADYMNNIWVSTYDNGLYLFRHKDRNTLYYPYNPSGIGRGITMIKKEADITAVGYANSTLDIYEKTSYKRYNIPGNKVITDLVSISGQWYVLTHENIYLANKKGIFPDSFSPLIYTYPKGNKANVFGKDIQSATDTYYSVAGNHLWKINSNTIQHDFLYTAANTILPIAPDDLYLGTSQGIWHNGQQLPYLTDEAINKMRLIKGTLIFCTESGAYTLPLTNRKTGNGLRMLTDNPCYDAQESDGYLFLRVTKGLIAYKPGSNYQVTQMVAGQYPVPFIISDFTVTATDVIVAGNKGIFYISKKDFLSIESDVPKVHIINALIGANPLDTSFSCPYSKQLSVAFSLDILDCNAGNFPIYYRLIYNGRPLNNWKHTNDTKVILTTLEPGTYNIEYLVKYKPGGNAITSRYTIIIMPLWWQALWFKWLSLGVSFLAIAILLWLFLKQIKRRHQLILKRKLHLYELESRKLYAQMNPHFIFNGIAVAHSLIAINEQEKALGFLAGFAKLLRNILNNSTEESISLEKELEALQQFLQLQELRLNNNFSYHIEADPGIDTQHTFLPPMMLQPFVENAIEHGIRPLIKGGHIAITITRHGTQCIKCMITDNGHGIDKQQNNSTGRKSLAIKITEERLHIMAEEKNCDAGITILPLYPDRTQKGTKIILKIPVQYD